MKKQFFVLLVLLVGFGSQLMAQGGASVGLKAGLNVSSLDGPDINNPESRIGYHLGFMAEVPVTDAVSLQPELLYSLQGEGERGIFASTNLHYLNLPIMAKVELINGINLQFGPYLGFLLGAKRGEVEVDKQYNTVDAGLGVGLGYRAQQNLDFSLRYQYGLIRVADDDFDDSNNYGNRIVQLSAGFFIN